jgi:hypothetical protein
MIIILSNDDGSPRKWETLIPREVGQVAQRKHPNNHLQIFSSMKVIFENRWLVRKINPKSMDLIFNHYIIQCLFLKIWDIIDN